MEKSSKDLFHIFIVPSGHFAATAQTVARFLVSANEVNGDFS